MSTETGRSGSSLDNVTRLESPAEYFQFRKEMRDYLQVQGYGSYLPGGDEVDEPVEIELLLSGVELRKELRIWKGNQQKAIGSIRSRCGENIRDALEEAKDTHKTVGQIWDLLEAKFKPAGSAAFQDLYFKWENTSLTTEKTVSNLAARLRAIRSDFKELDVNCAIGEPHLLMKFFSALGDDYRNFISTFFQTHSLVTVKKATGGVHHKAVTFETAVLKAIHEEQTQKLMTDQGGAKTALFAAKGNYHNNKGRNSTPKRSAPTGTATCHHCVKAGRRMATHKPEKCFFEHPELAPPDWKSHGDFKKRKDDNTKVNTANLAIRMNSTESALNPTFMTLRDDHETPGATPIHKPGVLTRMFSGFKTLMTQAVSSKPLSNIPQDSSTGRALMQLGLLSLPNEKAMDLAKKIAQCIILDSGCSQTNFSQKSLFTELRPYKGPPVYGINETVVTPEWMGTAKFEAEVNGRTEIITIQDAIYCPQLGANLISIAQLAKKGAEFLFHWDKAYASKGEHIFLSAHVAAGIYIVDQPNRSPHIAALNISLRSYSVDPILKVWHERLGHVSDIELQELMNMTTGIKPQTEYCICEACIEGRMSGKPHKGSLKKGTYPMESIHLDEAGMPKDTQGYEGSTGWLGITCDFSGRCWAIPLKTPSDWFSAFKDYLQKWERPERRCHFVNIDKLGSHTNWEFVAFCTQRGIGIRYSATNQHQQNGVIERTIRSIKDMVRELLMAATQREIPIKYWPILIQTAAYIKNRRQYGKNPKTPYEIWYGEQPDLSHMVTVGAMGWYMLPSKPNMLKPKTSPCQMLGYDGDGTHNYIVLKLDTKDNNKVANMNDVFFKEDHLHISTREAAEESRKRTRSLSPPPPANTRQRTEPRPHRGLELPSAEMSGLSSYAPAPPPTHTPAPPLPSPSVQTPAPTIGSSSGYSSRITTPNLSPWQTPSMSPSVDSLANSLADPPAMPPPPRIQLGSPIDDIPPDRYELRPRTVTEANSRYGLQAMSPNFMMAIAMISFTLIAVQIEPKSYKQAQYDPHWHQWYKAMGTEHRSLIDNRTWTMCKLPAGRNLMSGKWVYKIKRGPNGEVTRYKARWVVRGFEQIEGQDYNETFASVVKPMSYKALFAIAAALDLEIEQMDVVTAFLYGDVEEEVYVEQPPGFEDGTSRVCKLNKALYGLKQAPRVWYKTLADFLKSIGFEPLTSDIGVFARGHIYIAVYVDDLLIAGNDKEEIQEIKQALSTRFQMQDLGPCSFYLGMSITRDRPNRTIYLSQKAYLEKIIRDLGQWEAHTNATPLEVNKIPEPADKYEANRDDVKWYARAIGCLMYAMLGTRPDIAYAVSYLSRYMKNPTTGHLKAARRVLRYLKGTIDYKLTYEGDIKDLVGYTDADWGGCTQTRRSTGGYIFNLGSAAISWASKRQTTTALSSCESEQAGQTQATKEAIWLRGLLKELNAVTDDLRATIIWGDNQGAIAMTKNPQFHSKMKHVPIQQAFCREATENGDVEFHWLHTSQMVADGLTKPLPRDRFAWFRDAVGLRL